MNFSTEQYGIVLPCQDDRAKRGLICCTQGRMLKPVCTRIAADAALVRDALSRFPFLQQVFVGDTGSPQDEKPKRPIGLRQIERIAYFCPAAHPSSTEPGIARIFETVFKAVEELVFSDFSLCVGIGIDTHLRNQAVLPAGNATLLYDLPEAVRYRLTHLRLAMDMTRAFARNYLARLVPLLRLEVLEIVAPVRMGSRVLPSSLDFETLALDLKFPYLRALKIVDATMEKACLVRFLRCHRQQLRSLELVRCALVESGQGEGGHGVWRDIILELQSLDQLEALMLVDLHSAPLYAGSVSSRAVVKRGVPHRGRWGSRDEVVSGLRGLAASY